MDKHEAEQLAMQIEDEGEGWHTRVESNTWTGEWSVRAWQGENTEDEENCYVLKFRGQWYKLREGLRLEEREARYLRENAMPAFRFVYEIKSGIELRAEIEARLFVDAARELYDECGHMLQYVNLQDMTIARYGSEPGDLRYEYHRIYPCPECGVWYGEGCEVCHGSGYTTVPLEITQ